MAEPKTICLEVLELHCSRHETGRLDFQRDAYEGQIFIYGGFLVHAHLSGLEGVPALFRLFDWGDANVSWHAEEVSEISTLNLSMPAASILYAEHLHDRAGLDEREKARLEQDFDMQSLALDPVAALESVLKHYTISLECADKSLLPEGFVFSDHTKPSYVIGSAEDCDVILRHPSVDPLHCGVIMESGQITIWDLGSQAGIRINGQPVEQETLKVGDVVALGSVDLHVRFHLRRPNVTRAPTTAIPAEPVVKGGPPPKEIPKGAITYEKVSKALKNNDKSKPFLTKLGSLFGSKDEK